MSARPQVFLISLLLIALGLGLTIYKFKELGFPPLPGKYRTVWTIEAKVQFDADGGPVTAALTLPRVQQHLRILDETYSSAGYGFQISEEDDQYQAIWTRRAVEGRQHLFYKLSVYSRDEGVPSTPPQPPAAPAPGPDDDMHTPTQAAIASLVQRARELSANNRSFTVQLLKILHERDNRDAALLFESNPELSPAAVAVQALASGGVPAHLVRGIYLENDRKGQRPQELVEAYIDEQWLIFEPGSGEVGLPDNFFMWQRGGRSLLDVEGGSKSRVTFSISSNQIAARTVALQQSGKEAIGLVDFSIYSLPIEQQNIFKLILLVPIGTLVVIFLRVLVGLRTSGTFMPVLLALAFIQTQLLTGLAIFLLILVVGLTVRSYLSRLNLLLVSRIAAVVVVVVMIMAAISIVSYKLHIEQALTVTFFPMIILAWTIERMSILWEEDGGHEVFIQVCGSLMVAVAAYLLMTNRYIEHWTFNFPELTLCVLGVILLMGQYTGYRLSELMRFRQMDQER